MEHEIAHLLNSSPEDRQNIATFLSDYFCGHDDDSDTDTDADLDDLDPPENDHGTDTDIETTMATIQRDLDMEVVDEIGEPDASADTEMKKAMDYR
jgi:hypothetical protein